MVPPRPRQAGDEPLVNRTGARKDDGKHLSDLLGRPGRCRAVGEDDIHLQADELGRQRGQSLGAPFRIAVLQGDTLALHIPKVAEPVAEALEAGVGVKGGRQHPDPRRLRPRLRMGGVWR